MVGDRLAQLVAEEPAPGQIEPRLLTELAPAPNVVQVAQQSQLEQHHRFHRRLLSVTVERPALRSNETEIGTARQLANQVSGRHSRLQRELDVPLRLDGLLSHHGRARDLCYPPGQSPPPFSHPRRSSATASSPGLDSRRLAEGARLPVRSESCGDSARGTETGQQAGKAGCRSRARGPGGSPSPAWGFSTYRVAPLPPKLVLWADESGEVVGAYGTDQRVRAAGSDRLDRAPEVTAFQRKMRYR